MNRMQSSDTSEENLEQLFLDVVNIMLDLKVTTNIERLNLEYFTKFEYSLKHAQLFSAQHFINKEKIKSNDPLLTMESKLLSDDPICPKELNINIRQIITCVAQIARKSKVFAEKLLTQKVSTQLEPLNSKNVIDLVSDVAKMYIRDNQVIQRNLGLIMALTNLLHSLTVPYAQYSDIDKVDDSLDVLFTAVLICQYCQVSYSFETAEQNVHSPFRSRSVHKFQSTCHTHGRL
jgi:hypothetical protein